MAWLSGGKGLGCGCVAAAGHTAISPFDDLKDDDSTLQFGS